MIKFKNTFVKGIALIAIAVTLVSCQLHGIKGSGNITTENRNVSGDFKSIRAGKGLDVVIEQASTTSVTVIADDNVQKHINT